MEFSNFFIKGEKTGYEPSPNHMRIYSKKWYNIKMQQSKQNVAFFDAVFVLTFYISVIV